MEYAEVPGGSATLLLVVEPFRGPALKEFAIRSAYIDNKENKTLGIKKVAF